MVWVRSAKSRPSSVGYLPGRCGSLAAGNSAALIEKWEAVVVFVFHVDDCLLILDRGGESKV